MNELSNREFIKSLEQKIPSKKVDFDNPVDVKEFFDDENFSECEKVFKIIVRCFCEKEVISSIVSGYVSILACWVFIKR